MEALASWATAMSRTMRAPANAPVVHGDKERPELTLQYNEGYKVDLAEPHAGPGGCDEVNEIKLWTPLLKTSSPGVGNASSGGTPASVGHSYAFGNTEEKARRLNMGCKARGQPGQPFSHKNGHGYVKAHRGFYHDAIFVKRNNFNLLLHERDVRRRLLAHRRSQAALPHAQSCAQQRRSHGLLAQVLSLFYVPPCRAHLSLRRCPGIAPPLLRVKRRIGAT